MKKNYVVSIVAILGIICLAWGIFGRNPNTEKKAVACLITDKLTAGAGYKVSAHWYLIAQDEKGRPFDLDVTPVSFSRAKIGEKLIFELSEADIVNDGRDSLSGWHLMSAVMGGLLLLVALFIKIDLE